MYAVDENIEDRNPEENNEEQPRQKKWSLKKKIFIWGSIVLGVVFSIIILVYNVWIRDHPSATPANLGPTTSVGALKLPLPADWKVSASEDGTVSYAGPPNAVCSTDNPLGCKTIAVHDYRTYKGDWNSLTGNYNCPSNKADTAPQQASEPKAVEIGSGNTKIGATKRTIKLCNGTGGNAVLTLFDVPASPPNGAFLILVITNGPNAFANVERNLQSATIG